MAAFLLCLSTSAWSQTAIAYKTVMLSKGHIQFSLKTEDREQYAYSCPAGVCTCESDVEYIQLVPATRNSAVNSINHQLRLHASTVKCQYLDARDSVHEKVTHLSRHFVSVVEEFWSQQIDTGGSCHGSSTVHTFDLTSGREYTLADLISPSSLSRLRSSLPASLVAEQNRQVNEQRYETFKADATAEMINRYKPYVEPPAEAERDLSQAEDQIESMNDQQLLTMPIFLKDRHVYINVEGYYFSCAEGSFHPAEIPVQLITLPSLRQEMGKQ